MALKLVLFVSVMVAALALPIAKAQLSINPSTGVGIVVQVQPSFVPCSLGANVTANPGFPSKFAQNLLQLVQCTMTKHFNLS